MREELAAQRRGNSTTKDSGSLHYTAPEHLNDVSSRPSEKSDVFSFAIVLWAVFANKEPYESKAVIEEWDLSTNQSCSMEYGPSVKSVKVYHCLFI